MIIEVCSDLLDYCSGISSSLMKSFILKMPFSYAIESRYSVVVGKVPQTVANRTLVSEVWEFPFQRGVRIEEVCS